MSCSRHHIRLSSAYLLVAFQCLLHSTVVWLQWTCLVHQLNAALQLVATRPGNCAPTILFLSMAWSWLADSKLQLLVRIATLTLLIWHVVLDLVSDWANLRPHVTDYLILRIDCHVSRKLSIWQAILIRQLAHHHISFVTYKLWHLHCVLSENRLLE